MRTSYTTKFTVTRHPKNNKNKATSSLFLVKMIAKLERTQSNAYQNKDQHRTIPQTMGGTVHKTISILTWQYLNCLHKVTRESVVACTDHFTEAFVQGMHRLARAFTARQCDTYMHHNFKDRHRLYQYQYNAFKSACSLGCCPFLEAVVLLLLTCCLPRGAMGLSAVCDCGIS